MRKKKHNCFRKPVVFRKDPTLPTLLLSNYKFSFHKHKSNPCMVLSEHCFLQHKLGRIIGCVCPNQNTNQWKLVGLGRWWVFLFVCLPLKTTTTKKGHFTARKIPASSCKIISSVSTCSYGWGIKSLEGSGEVLVVIFFFFFF